MPFDGTVIYCDQAQWVPRTLYSRATFFRGSSKSADLWVMFQLVPGICGGTLGSRAPSFGTAKHAGAVCDACPCRGSLSWEIWGFPVLWMGEIGFPRHPGGFDSAANAKKPVSTTQLFKAGLLIFWFSLVGLYLVEVPKGSPFINRSFAIWATETMVSCRGAKWS